MRAVCAVRASARDVGVDQARLSSGFCFHACAHHALTHIPACRYEATGGMTASDIKTFVQSNRDADADTDPVGPVAACLEW